MRGLTFEAIESVQFHRDLPEPEIQQPRDVIVSVLRAGICGSDLHQFHGREPVAAGTIPGHEFVGEVVAAGRDVQRIRVGDRVFSPFTTCCGHCFFCEHAQAGGRILESRADGKTNCFDCPGNMVSRSFHCENWDSYNWAEKPVQFYKKLVQLYKKYKERTWF